MGQTGILSELLYKYIANLHFRISLYNIPYNYPFMLIILHIRMYNLASYQRYTQRLALRLKYWSSSACSLSLNLPPAALWTSTNTLTFTHQISIYYHTSTNTLTFTHQISILPHVHQYLNIHPHQISIYYHTSTNTLTFTHQISIYYHTSTNTLTFTHTK